MHDIKYIYIFFLNAADKQTQQNKHFKFIDIFFGLQRSETQKKDY